MQIQPANAEFADLPLADDVRAEVQPLSDGQFRAELARITPHLRAFARTLSGCRDRADDLAQEAMLKAWSARGSFRAGTNFKAWVFTILRNHFYSEMRRNRFVGDYDEQMAEITLRTAGNQEDALELADVLRALETLPASHRDCLILAAVGDMPYEEIAAICDIAIGTVKSRICRARAMLVALLDGGILPDARHNHVMEADAVTLMFDELRRAMNANMPHANAA